MLVCFSQTFQFSPTRTSIPSLPELIFVGSFVSRGEPLRSPLSPPTFPALPPSLQVVGLDGVCNHGGTRERASRRDWRWDERERARRPSLLPPSVPLGPFTYDVRTEGGVGLAQKQTIVLLIGCLSGTVTRGEEVQKSQIFADVM